MHTYTIEGDKSSDLAKLITQENLSDGEFFPFEVTTFLDKLKRMSKNDEVKPYKMARQKIGNCYVKEVEAGLKYALWSRNPKGEKVKWPITTLQMHKKFTDELVQNLDQAGYSKLIELIKSDFEKYRSEKKEVNPKNWREKNARILLNERPENTREFSSDTVKLLKNSRRVKIAMEDIEKNDGAVIKEVDILDKKELDLENLCKSKNDEYDLENEKSEVYAKKLNKYRKLNPILKFFKRSKIKATKREFQKLNDKLLSLKGELDNAKKSLNSHKEKKKNYIDKIPDAMELRDVVNLCRDRLNEFKAFKEKHPYLFKTNEPPLSINETKSQAIQKAKSENSRKVVNPVKDMRIAK